MPSPTNQQQSMDFYQALAQLPLGWKITRASWGNENIYGFLDMSYVKLHKEDGSVHNWIISEGDMVAEDWHMVVEVIVDEEVISSPLVCSHCKKQDNTVSKRKCGYAEDVLGTEVWEVICDDCEHEHLMDI